MEEYLVTSDPNIFPGSRGITDGTGGDAAQISTPCLEVISLTNAHRINTVTPVLSGNPRQMFELCWLGLSAFSSGHILSLAKDAAV